jgi:hypothetical protein
MTPKEAINKQLRERLEDTEKEIESAFFIVRHKIIETHEIKALLECPHTEIESSAWAELSWHRCKACGVEVRYAD